MKTNLPKNTNILYLEAIANYTMFHLIDGSKVMSSFTLKKHEKKQELNTFLRVSRSCLLNPLGVKIIRKEGNRFVIELIDGKCVIVSRRRIGVINNFKKFA